MMSLAELRLLGKRSTYAVLHDYDTDALRLFYSVSASRESKFGASIECRLPGIRNMRNHHSAYSKMKKCPFADMFR